MSEPPKESVYKQFRRAQLEQKEKERDLKIQEETLKSADAKTKEAAAIRKKIDDPLEKYTEDVICERKERQKAVCKRLETSPLCTDGSDGKIAECVQKEVGKSESCKVNGGFDGDIQDARKRTAELRKETADAERKLKDAELDVVPLEETLNTELEYAKNLKDGQDGAAKLLDEITSNRCSDDASKGLQYFLWLEAKCSLQCDDDPRKKEDYKKALGEAAEALVTARDKVFDAERDVAIAKIKLEFWEKRLEELEKERDEVLRRLARECDSQGKAETGGGGAGGGAGSSPGS